MTNSPEPLERGTQIVSSSGLQVEAVGGTILFSCGRLATHHVLAQTCENSFAREEYGAPCGPPSAGTRCDASRGHTQHFAKELTW